MIKESSHVNLLMDIMVMNVNIETTSHALILRKNGIDRPQATACSIVPSITLT